MSTPFVVLSPVAIVGFVASTDASAWGPAAALDEAKLLWNDLLEDLTWECVEVDEVSDAVPDLMRSYGLQSYDAVHAATLLTSGVTDMLTRDAGFAVLLPEDATPHTTRRRLSSTRARRRDACS